LGFLGTTASNIVDINLILQVLIITSLTIGYILARRAKFIDHGKLMSIAVSLNVLSFVFVMLPSLIEGAGAFVSIPTNPGVIISEIHILVGGYALASGINFVYIWWFSKSYQRCLGNRRWMRWTAALWAIATMTGIAFYSYYYIILGV
jgi:uncharacterized membrane protein YozB (DUF420 family)